MSNIKTEEAVVYRVISEVYGLVWTGTDPARAHDQALVTAVNTGRSVYLQEGDTL